MAESRRVDDRGIRRHRRHGDELGQASAPDTQFNLQPMPGTMVNPRVVNTAAGAGWSCGAGGYRGGIASCFRGATVAPGEMAPAVTVRDTSQAEPTRVPASPSVRHAAFEAIERVEHDKPDPGEGNTIGSSDIGSRGPLSPSRRCRFCSDSGRARSVRHHGDEPRDHFSPWPDHHRPVRLPGSDRFLPADARNIRGSHGCGCVQLDMRGLVGRRIAVSVGPAVFAPRPPRTRQDACCVVCLEHPHTHRVVRRRPVSRRARLCLSPRRHR